MLYHYILRRLCPSLFALAFCAGSALADGLRVVTDILPVHALVSRVMAGTGTPDVILRPGASPHDHALRPSEAAALARADAVFWVGPGLTPWLANSLAVLADRAAVVALIETPGTQTLPYREGADFAGDHDHGHGHGNDHGHDDGFDPHAWLDPENGKAWLGVIAAELSRLDPANADTYARNARFGADEIDAVTGEIESMLAPLRGTPFVVYHDAFQYFESRFGILAAGSITDSDDAAPGPARIAEIRETVARLGVGCVFGEPGAGPALTATVLQGTAARLAEVDPLGASLAPGAGLYPRLLRDMADRFAGCLGSA